MSRLTKISPYRAGELRFGRRDYQDEWKPTLNEYKLTPEELEAYKNGKSIDDILKERNETKMSQPKVISYNKYLEVEAERDELKKQLEELKANANQSNDDQEIEHLKREVIDAHKLVTEKEEEIARLRELFETAMADKEQLHNEVILLENQIQRLKEVNEELTKRNERYFSDINSLEQEVKGLRIYALQKLHVDVYGEGRGSIYKTS